MNKVNSKISFFSNIQNIIKENIKIIIYFIICIVIIIAGYQIYFFNKEKKILFVTKILHLNQLVCMA